MRVITSPYYQPPLNFGRGNTRHKTKLTKNLELMKKTERIAGFKPVVANGIEQIIITTASGAEVWLTKDKFDDTQKSIMFTARKAGDKYTDKAGNEQSLKSDRNDFEGYAIVDNLERQMELAAKYGVKIALS